MTYEEYFKIVSLDPEGVDGTIQTFLLSNPPGTDLKFDEVLFSLLRQSVREKLVLVNDNINLSRMVDQLKEEK